MEKASSDSVSLCNYLIALLCDMQVEIEALQQEVERERNLKLQAEGAAARALLRNTPSEASTPREIELEGELQVVKSAQRHLMQATKVDKAELSAGENPDNVFFSL